MSYRNDTIVTGDIEDVLLKAHKKDLCFVDLRLSSGFELESRVDFLSLNVMPSTGNRCTAYEIKVSRSDFRRDNHRKQRGARLYSDHFWYIAPKGVIPHEEVPDWAGLKEIEWTTTPRGEPYLKIRTVIQAPKRDKSEPSWGLLVSMIRNAVKRGETDK